MIIEALVGGFMGGFCAALALGTYLHRRTDKYYVTEEDMQETLETAMVKGFVAALRDHTDADDAEIASAFSESVDKRSD